MYLFSNTNYQIYLEGYLKGHQKLIHSKAENVIAFKLDLVYLNKVNMKRLLRAAFKVRTFIAGKLRCIKKIELVHFQNWNTNLT